ncbi:hypothetical protein ETAA8_37720 [Anatilimnocola aggregata]|uniref:DUF2254 domain-containing protein n=1 Tax=Anatilimnocola aggregata TaxID=2528021 RepID=A0A517YEM8_9BACT|nr:DUF2254 domain-containing protein [Anatilimnocola aggregata]QDU28669.1 hypothetical protein ETAA8_37720 [Anatilimnocola aggregata]
MTETPNMRWIMRLRHWSQELRASFWFVPAAIVVGAVLVATAIIGVDANIKLRFVEDWPLLFGAGAAGSRGLLTAVASSMITVAGVVFSITIVALSLTSSQYTSRVLRNFMRDRINQMVLGVFVGIFAYCLVVLRTIRGGDEQAFVPSLAVLGGLLLAFVGIAFLIYYIHHIALSIQASSIIAAVASETIAAVDHLFPKGLGEAADKESDDNEEHSGEVRAWTAVPARVTGYIESIDGDALLALAQERETIFRMERGIGEFVIEGTPLISIGVATELAEDEIGALNAVYVVGRQRTVQQDAGFGIRQIVDIALKALSPGINDTTTAVMCVDYLAAVLVRLATRDIPALRRKEGGKTRLLARGPTFQSLLAEAFDQIRQNAEGNVAILTRQVDALEIIGGATDSGPRRESLRTQADLIIEVADRTIAPHDCAGIKAAKDRLRKLL